MSEIDFLTGRPRALAPIYDALAPDPDAEYGTILPFAVNRVGSPSWVAEGRNLRFAMPGFLRSTLQGISDLGASTQTGTLTPEALGTVVSGALGGGIAGAPRGALAAGGARPPLPMDTASRLARADTMGHRIRVFHGTNREINPGFSIQPPYRATSGMSGREGVWGVESPEVAAQHADWAAGLPVGTTEAAGQNIVPLLGRSDRPATIRLQPGDDDRILTGAIRDAWDAGYDAVRVSNYPNLSTGASEVAWVFKNPNQLRSPLARFDPSKRSSDDLLAASATPGFNFVPPPQPGFNVQSPGFRFDPEAPALSVVEGVPNSVRRPQDRVY
jgi:hypothetical protein